MGNNSEITDTPAEGHSSRGKQEAGEAGGGRKTLPGSVAGFQAPTWAPAGAASAVLWAGLPTPCSVQKRTRGSFINCLPCPTGFHSLIDQAEMALHV